MPEPEPTPERELPSPEQAAMAQQEQPDAAAQPQDEAGEQPSAAPPEQIVPQEEDRPPSEAQAPPLEPEQPEEPPTEQPRVPPVPGPPPGYFYPPPTWYPMPIMPPGFGYPPQGPYQGAGLPGPPPPQMAPGAPVGPQAPPGFEPPPYPQDVYQPPFAALEGEEFGELILTEPSHWHGDLKWLFGVLTAIVLLATIAVAGLYRITGQGVAKQLLVPIIEDAAQVNQKVSKNYQSLRSKARKKPGSTITIPDIGVTVSMRAADINSLGSEDLANRVNLEIERQIYSQGYEGNLPMSAAQGVGEERAKAVCATILSLVNQKTHKNLLWLLVILAAVSVILGILFIIFCRGWGKAIGAGIVLICTALPFSLLVRVGNEFIWKPGVSGAYKGAMFQALRDIGSSSVMFFDIALGVGALLLLIGVIGNTVAKKSRRRVPPFRELEQPDQVVAGPPVELGLEMEDNVQAGDTLKEFGDLKPPPGDSV